MTDPAAARSELDAIFDAGGAACERGLSRGANPYGTTNATEAVTWDRGWLGRHDAMMLDLKAQPAAARSLAAPRGLLEKFFRIVSETGPGGIDAMGGAVPEPTSVLLLSLGLAGAWAKKRFS